MHCVGVTGSVGDACTPEHFSLVCINGRIFFVTFIRMYHQLCLPQKKMFQHFLPFQGWGCKQRTSNTHLFPSQAEFGSRSTTTH